MNFNAPDLTVLLELKDATGRDAMLKFDMDSCLFSREMAIDDMAEALTKSGFVIPDNSAVTWQAWIEANANRLWCKITGTDYPGAGSEGRLLAMSELFDEMEAIERNRPNSIDTEDWIEILNAISSEEPDLTSREVIDKAGRYTFTMHTGSRVEALQARFEEELKNLPDALANAIDWQQVEGDVCADGTEFITMPGARGRTLELTPE